MSGEWEAWVTWKFHRRRYLVTFVIDGQKTPESKIQRKGGMAEIIGRILLPAAMSDLISIVGL
jgi:hypothetical protein